MSDFFSMPPWPPNLSAIYTDRLSRHAESSESKIRPSNGYANKVRVHDRYKVVGFISSGTYGRVYKAVGVNGQTGDFAIKKYYPLHPLSLTIHKTMIDEAISDSNQTRKAK